MDAIPSPESARRLGIALQKSILSAMRARTLAWASIGVAVMAASFFVPAAFAEADIALVPSIVSSPAIPAGPPGTYENAFKPGDSIQIMVRSLSPDLQLSADLSGLGVPTTTISSAFGPYYGPIYGSFYPNTYAYYIGPFTIGAVPDGPKDILISASDSSSDATSSSMTLVVDTAQPTVSITSITFSSTTPGENDYLYVSGTFDGTGSPFHVARAYSSASDADGANVDGCGEPITLNATALIDAIATSTDGTFANVPMQIFECNHPGYMASHDAKMFTVSLDAYDEAGNTGHAELTVPYPQPQTASGVSNVLFLPGTEASRLYMRNSAGAEHEVWEPTLSSDVSRLALNPDGSSVNEIYTRDIIGTFFGNDVVKSQIVQTTFGRDAMVYRDFEDYMDSLVASSTFGLKEWKAYPYDWRYDVRDIVADGTLVGERNGPLTRVYLIDTVKQMAADSPTGKVTIIAHSNGGLLAKALTDAMGADASTYIDRIIMIGTPQFGTPSAVGAMEHADNFSDLPNFIINKTAARSVESQLPDAYDLLPSRAYFAHISDPLVTFNQRGQLTSPFASAYGSQINSYSAFTNFLIDSAGLDATTGATSSLKSLLPLNPSLLTHADVLHGELDARIPPAGIQVVSIAGWGQDTLKTLNYWTGSHAVCNGGGVFSSGGCADAPELEHDAITTQDGDGTVISLSAIGDIGQRWFFNLKDYNKQNNTSLQHQNVSSSISVQHVITTVLKNGSISDPLITSQTPSGANNPIVLRVSSHSPVNILLTDVVGSESGVIPIPDTDFSGVKEDIPGSSVFVLDDEEYINVPEEGTYSVHVTGYDEGPTTLRIEQVDQNGIATTTTTFADIPTTASTTATFAISNGIPTSPAVDMNGDGTQDFIVAGISSSTNPLDYVMYMRKAVVTMGLDRKITSQLDAKLINIAHLIRRDGKWDTDDEDKDDSPRGMKLDQQIQRRIEKLYSYVDRQVAKDERQQNKKHPSNAQAGIPSNDAEIILDMIKELQTLAL